MTENSKTTSFLWMIRFSTLLILILGAWVVYSSGIQGKIAGILLLLVIIGAYIFAEILRSMIRTVEEYERRYAGSDKSFFTTISAHTYKPDKAVVPPRGWIILDRVHQAATEYDCPVLFNVGHTVKGERRTESEIYRDAYMSRYGSCTKIIVASDESVRETQAEVFHTVERIEELESYRHLLIILAPHLKRAMQSWRRFLPLRHAELVILPVPAPARYWLWEAAMLVIVFFLPPGSKRQQLVLNMVGRKG